jgi:hypothetical protein
MAITHVRGNLLRGLAYDLSVADHGIKGLVVAQKRVKSHAVRVR